MSIPIHIKHIKKIYDNNVVIPDLNLEVQGGEFFTLLGPSGCGKTTLLRMIAGFNSIDAGEIYFDDKLINNIEPSKRNIGMVFQNYAIFPHMTVSDNVSFGLKNKKLGQDEIAKTTNQFLELMQIKEYKDRRPDKLSGGQQQRVALARALAISPQVLLMDEPLSNLDAKLRLEMREVIRDIQKKVGITTVYVTHDQEEAMAVSDKIAVMKNGIIQQIGTPKELYHRPKNIFVASFIGNTNILNGQLYKEDNKMYVQLKNGYKLSSENFVNDYSGDIKISVRPEDFIISNQYTGIKGIVEKSTFLGTNTKLFIKLESNELIEVTRESSFEDNIEINSEIYLEIKVDKINIFKIEGNFISLMKNEI